MNPIKDFKQLASTKNQKNSIVKMCRKPCGIDLFKCSRVIWGAQLENDWFLRPVFVGLFGSFFYLLAPVAMKRRYRFFPNMRMVWELVHSMTQGEVLRFWEIARATTSEPENLAYVVFFRILLTHDQFDKAKVKESLVNTTTLKRLGDSLCYLYHAVLKALQTANDEVTRDVFDLTAQLQILLNKGLHSHMDMLHGQAMKFALEIEDFEGQMKLLRLRQSALLQTKAGTELREILESLQTEEKNVWAKMRNLRKWERLISKRFIAKTIKQPEREHLVQSILNHPLVVNDGPCLSIKAEIARLTLKEKLIGIDKLNMPDRIPLLLQIAALIEANGSLMEDAQVVERFLFATFNAGLLAGDARRDEEMSTALNMLERFGESRPDTEVLVFERVEMIRFIRTLDDLDIEGAERVSKRIRKGLDSFGDRLSLQLRAEFINQLSFFYLLKAKNSDAAKFLIQNLDVIPMQDNPKRNLLPWIMFLIAHLSLGNWEVLISYAVHAQKYLTNHKLDDDLAKTAFTFFERYAKLTDNGRRLQALEKFQMDLKELLLSPSNAYYRTIPIDDWVMSRIIGKSWLYVIKDARSPI